MAISDPGACAWSSAKSAQGGKPPGNVLSKGSPVTKPVVFGIAYYIRSFWILPAIIAF